MANASSQLSLLNASDDDIMKDLLFTNMELSARRNIYVGTFSILISLSSGVLIVTKQLKRAVKVLLINLIVCDVMVMTAALIYGSYAQMDNMNAGNSLCLTIVFLITYGSLMCNGAVLAISLNNFVAIFYPYRYNKTFTTKRVLMGVMALWIGLACFCLGSIGIKFQPGPACAALAIIPRYGILMLSVVAITFRLAVITMNVMLCIRLRTRRRTNYKQQTPSKKDSDSNMITSHRAYLNTGKVIAGQLLTSKSCTPDKDKDIILPSSLAKMELGPYQNKEDPLHQRQQNKIVELTTKMNACPNQEYDPSAFANVIEVQTKRIEKTGQSSHNHSTCPQSPDIDNKALFDTTVYRHSNDAELTSNHSASKITIWCNISSSQKTSHKDDAAVHDPEKMCSHSGPKARGIKNLEHSHENHASQPDNIVTRSNQDSQKAGHDRYRDLSVTMIIIALWCCLVNFPFLGYMIYVGAVVDNRVEAIYSVYGIMSSTFLIINVLGDPVIYAWRFINWKAISKNVCSMFQRRKSG